MQSTYQRALIEALSKQTVLAIHRSRLNVYRAATKNQLSDSSLLLLDGCGSSILRLVAESSSKPGGTYLDSSKGRLVDVGLRRRHHPVLVRSCDDNRPRRSQHRAFCIADDFVLRKKFPTHRRSSPQRRTGNTQRRALYFSPDPSSHFRSDSSAAIPVSFAGHGGVLHPCIHTSSSLSDQFVSKGLSQNRRRGHQIVGVGRAPTSSELYGQIRVKALT